MLPHRTLLIILIVLMLRAEAIDRSQYKLALVQILFRHGDRSPVVLYPTDPNPASDWPGGLGALTKLGKQQLYSVGLQLRRRYKHFITTNPLEIKVNSSAYQRCLESAESFLASFYAPTDEYKFNPNVDWQPIPILTRPTRIDKYDLQSYCPEADVEEQRIIQSPEGQAYLSKHKEMLDYVTIHSGRNVTDWIMVYLLHDALFIEKKYNLIMPEWTKKYWNELKQVADEAFYWWFKSTRFRRLRAGALLGVIIKSMHEKINGSYQDLKFRVYSAHDDNIASILDIYDIFPMKSPPYAATLLFELHSGPNNSNYVRLLYMNSTEPEKGLQEPNILKLHGCEEFCPLEFFANSAQPYIPNDWKKECGITH